MRRRHWSLAVVCTATGLAGCGGAEEVAREPTPSPVAAVAPGAAAAPATVSADPLVHLRDLVAGGPRAAGTPGADAAERLVADRLRAAGWAVRTERVTFPVFRERSRPRTTPRVEVLRTLQHSGSGHVRGRVTAVRGVGCAAADWAGVDRGEVALVRRGTCTFASKARRARDAGAAALVVEDPSGPPRGLSLERPGTTIPAVATDRAGAARLRRAGTVTVRTDVDSRTGEGRNVLAQRPGKGAPLVLGAHLDSVPEGPGANDNATGVAALLALAAEPPATRRPLQLAFWAGEELGLHGSRRHVRALGEGLPHAYLNLDMVAGRGTPLEVYGAGDPAEALRDALRGERPASIGDGSDHAPFRRAGVPVAGVYSGKGDPCYHRACDRIANVDAERLREVTRAVARAARDLGA